MRELTFDAIARLEELESRLQSELAGRIRDLEIFDEGNGVILRGIACTFHAKQLAQHAVMRGTHVPIFANEIEVA